MLVALCVNLLLHRLRPEFCALVTAASGILLGVYVLREAAGMFASLTDLASAHGMGGWAGLLLKAIGIAVACQLTAALCRDCGESALAEKAELAGKIAILALTFPVLQQILELF